MPVTALIAVTAFLLAAIPTRYISFGSIVAAVTLIFTVSVRKFILGQTVGEPTFILTLIVGVLILITHRGNIRRLLHGTERKFSFK
jgi:glycerol-3-phosphate acyltransferase PlsY